MTHRIADREPRIADCDWVLVTIVALFCLLGVIHSVVVPIFEAPDEIWHFSFVQVLATQRHLPVQSIESKDPWLREAGQPPLYYLVAAPFVAPLDTSNFPDFVRFNVAHPAVTPGARSEAPNIFIHTPSEAFPYRGAVLAVHVVRLLSVLWGAGTVVGTYLAACEVVPARPGLALAAASLTAFNPHFIFISSVVNNDVCAACVCAFVLWLTIRLTRETKPFGANLVSLGVALGLGLLTKMSALALLALVVLALGLVWWRDRAIGVLLGQGFVAFGLAGLVGGWWYVRNWSLYDDPLARGVWIMDLPPSRFGLVDIVRQLGHVATSYWSPYDGLFPSPVFWGLGLLALLVIAGWGRLVVQLARRGVGPKVSREGLLLAGTWFVLLFGGLVKYMVTTPSDEGRLLFPGIAAFSLLLVLGLATAVSKRWTGVTIRAVGAGFLALSIASPLCAIRPRYALPLVTSTAGIPQDKLLDDAVFDRVRLVGFDVAPDEAKPGETVSVTLYWKAQAEPPADLRAVVQLWTFGGRLVGQRDATPAGDVYPPDLWRAGDIVRDVYRMQMDENRPAICYVTVLVLAGERKLGQASPPAALKLTGAPVSPEEIAYPLTYILGERIELVGYDLPGSPPLSGEPLTVTLYWRALVEMDEDYVVFVHLLSENESENANEDGTPYAQGDGPPLDNDYPTSYWSPGEVLADTHIVPLEGDLPQDAHLLVGLYRLADGTRLPAYTGDGEHVADDAIKLNTNVW